MAIAAGQKIIADDGFRKSRAHKVATKIGYTVGTIYNVFESHDELILNINPVMLDTMEAFITKRLNSDLEGRAQIKNLTGCYLEFTKTHHARWRALFKHHLPANAPLPDWYAEKIQGLFYFVEQPLHAIGANKKKIEQAAKTI